MNQNTKRRTSLKDLACELGVSIATVSRALRDSHEISTELKAKVKALALKTNYRPNPFAQSLRSEAPKMIGVVVPNMVSHYYAAVLDGVEKAARREGYTVISANSHEDFEDEARAIDNFISLHVDGIIACLSQNTTDYSHFEEIDQMGIPLVFFGRTCLRDRFSSVTANGDDAARKAVQHLIDTGSRRIAFVGGPNHLDMVQRRKHGYLEALRDNHLPIDPRIVACDRLDFQAAMTSAIRLLRDDNPPDAILAFNDDTTFACLYAIRQMGLRLPDDVALIGFSEDPHTAFITPRLSVIEDQSAKMGQRAAEILLAEIKGNHEIQHEIVPQRLVIRDTSIKNKLNH